MADSKVSGLTAATSLGGSDLLYLVQSNTSKKITVANFFSNASNVKLSGNINIGGTPQSLGSPGLISLTTPITHLSVDSSGGILQLPEGTNGQIKILTLISSSGGTYTVNPTHLASSANVKFNSVGDTSILLFTQNKWYVIGQFDANSLPSVNYVNGFTGNVTLTTANVNESGNLYFTNSRAINSLTAGSGVSISANGLITSTATGAVSSVNGQTGAVVLTTANVNESGNLYYSDQRVYSNVSLIGFLTSSNLVGYTTNSQLADYVTISSFNTKANVADLNTSNVSEGSNLYFSNSRVYDNVVSLGYATQANVNAALTDLSSSNTATFKRVTEIFSSISDANSVVVHDCSNGHIFNHSSIDNNFTVNLINLDLPSGEATSISLILNQGANAYVANALQINGVNQSIKWQANTQPTGNINAVDIETFSVFNVSGTYTVLGQLTTFG